MTHRSARTDLVLALIAALTGLALGGGSSSVNAAGEAAADVDPSSISADCLELATNPLVNWRDTRLSTDQEIVECLATTLGRPVGYGENTRGGFDPAGGSKLTIITKNPDRSVEQQILDAVTGDQPNWIVFDKNDFSEEFEIGLYRLQCGNSTVQSLLGASEQECVDFRLFCANRNIAADQCIGEFFNHQLNNGDLPIRNIVVGSNKTLDGRFSKAFFLFSGFAIGADLDGAATLTSHNVILTHLDFRGAGKVEDHELDPDMIRSTGESSDIWIHKNSFDRTGDSAFDVKVGARNITISFNRLTDVERAALHGQGDGPLNNAQIRTTIHNNSFITRDERYLDFQSARRVPLIRRGTSHLFNNFFMNYRKDILSVRVGASILFEENLFLVNQDLMEKETIEGSLAELSGRLVRDVDGGNFAGSGMVVALASRDCILNPAARTEFSVASGQVRDILQEYSERSRAIILAERQMSGQELVNYTNATAGKDGQVPFNSPLSPGKAAILQLPTAPCQ